jgi:hypothetical protein
MVPVKKGLQPVQRDGLEYEFDLLADIDMDHNFAVGKTRCTEMDGFRCEKVDHTFGERLVKWLNSGKPEERAKPVATAPSAPSESLGVLGPCEPHATIKHNGKDVAIFKTTLDPGGEFYAQGEAIAAELGLNAGKSVVLTWRANPQGKRVVQSVRPVEVPSAA